MGDLSTPAAGAASSGTEYVGRTEYAAAVQDLQNLFGEISSKFAVHESQLSMTNQLFERVHQTFIDKEVAQQVTSAKMADLTSKLEVLEQTVLAQNTAQVQAATFNSLTDQRLQSIETAFAGSGVPVNQTASGGGSWRKELFDIKRVDPGKLDHTDPLAFRTWRDDMEVIMGRIGMELRDAMQWARRQKKQVSKNEILAAHNLDWDRVQELFAYLELRTVSEARIDRAERRRRLRQWPRGMEGST